MRQEKITLHFSRVLTPAAVDEIHERIISESRLAREIHESLARSALSDRVSRFAVHGAASGNVFAGSIRSSTAGVIVPPAASDSCKS